MIIYSNKECNLNFLLIDSMHLVAFQRTRIDRISSSDIGMSRHSAVEFW